MNSEDFGGLVTDYEKLVYTICFQFTREHYIAQDLTQETFLSVYTHLDSCPKENPKAWIARVATNKAKDYLKSAYNRRVQMTSDDAMPNEGALFLSACKPEENLETSEGCQVISEEIHNLKEPYHQVAVLHFLQDFSVAEIAQYLGRPKKTVQTQIFRARQQLRSLPSIYNLVPAI